MLLALLLPLLPQLLALLLPLLADLLARLPRLAPNGTVKFGRVLSQLSR